MKATPMRYHGPGWQVETRHRLYQLWGPGKVVHQDFPDVDTGKTRDFWQSTWHDDRMEDRGEFYRGPDRDAALKIFPPKVRAAFEEAAK